MQPGNSKANINRRFWLLLLIQALGSQIILWGGIPVYRRLHEPEMQGAHLWEFGIALGAIAIMQTAHWLAMPLLPRLHLRRNQLLGYALITLGEGSLFFASALSAYIIFDLSGATVSIGKALILAAILYAANCYKHMLGSIGDEMINAPAGTANQTGM